MAWDLTTAKARLNIVGATQDAQVQAALDTTLDLVELYLDRKLMFGADTENFFGQQGAYQLRRWPLDTITDPVLEVQGFSGFTSLPVQWIVAGNPGGSPTATKVTLDSSVFWADRDKGIIYTPRAVFGYPLNIRYSGGYQTLPSVLEWAMFAAFDAVWQSSPAFGGTAGSGLVQGTGEVKKVSLVGVGSVDFDVGTTAVGSTSSTGNPWGLLPGTVTAVLDRYRNTAPIGLG